MLTHTRNIVRLLVTDGEFVLLAKVIKKGFFFLPGGGIEYNEPLLAAAERELFEELAVSSDVIQALEPLGLYEHSWDDNGSSFHEMNIVCRCEIAGLSAGQEVKSSEAHLAFQWVALRDLSTIDLRPEAFATLIPLWSEQSSTARQSFASSMRE